MLSDAQNDKVIRLIGTKKPRIMKRVLNVSLT